MFDVSLYGHITIDHIVSKDQSDTSIGSMGNVWKSLIEINPKLRIDLQPTDFGEALVFIDLDKSTRASTANLSLHNKKPLIHQSKWHHILYLNELVDFDFINDIDSGIVSVDFCRGKILQDIDVLKNVDFVFISDEDVFMDLSQMSHLVKRGVIMHHKNGSEYYTSGAKTFEYKVEDIEMVNVLGCGDRLVSGFINSFITNNKIEKSLEISHDLLTIYLEDHQKPQ